MTFCENQAIIYNYFKQKRLSFGNDLATQSNAKVLSKNNVNYNMKEDLTDFLFQTGEDFR